MTRYPRPPGQARAVSNTLPGAESPSVILAATRPVKRSFAIAGHRTSISLEAPFWEALRVLAAEECVPVSRLIARIDQSRAGSGLSSAVRIWILAQYRQRACASKA
jgi:predicted DNA-binding ribbon-helix-helix protein